MRDPRHNKGLAFTEKERDAHYLTGLLPPAVFSQDLQVGKQRHELTHINNHGFSSFIVFWRSGETSDEDSARL